jgi:hypothetical protein
MVREFEIKSEAFGMSAEDFFIRFLHSASFKQLYHERRGDTGTSSHRNTHPLPERY